MTGERPKYVPHIVASLTAAISIAVSLVVHFEGKSNVQYLDPPGIPTIGYGHTEGVKIGETATDKQIKDWLNQDLGKSAQAFAKYVNVPVPPASSAAFLDFIFNTGSGNFANSSALKKLNSGDLKGACEALATKKLDANGVCHGYGCGWSGGVMLKQLQARRQAEYQLCMKGVK